MNTFEKLATFYTGDGACSVWHDYWDNNFVLVVGNSRKCIKNGTIGKFQNFPSYDEITKQMHNHQGCADL